MIFHTGLVALKHEVQKLSYPLIKGRGWEVSFECDSWLNRKVKGVGSSAQDAELIIKAQNWATAQKALDLISGSLTLLDGSMSLGIPMGEFFVYCSELKDSERQPIFAPSALVIRGGIPRACFVASKACNNKKYVYAISKVWFSLSQSSIPDVDFFEVYPKSSLPIMHVIWSQAIIAAYSAIEELGLEVRVKQNERSMHYDAINNEWIWNERVLTDLFDRLTMNKIDLSRNFFWAKRGTIDRIEEKRKLQSVMKAPWAIGGLVRDREIPLTVALAYASWVRSKVASHKFNILSTSIDPFLVNNIQFLARRLILETLGFFEG